MEKINIDINDLKKAAFELKMEREERGITLRKLMEMTGINNGNLSKIENGGRGMNLENLVRIAKAMSIKVEMV